MKRLLLLSLAAVGPVACSADATSTSDEANLTASGLIGDLHAEARSSDESSFLDGSLTDLALKVDGNNCSYEAVVATGCTESDYCRDNDVLTDHGKKVAGPCTMASDVLTLDGAGGGLQFRVKVGSNKGKKGFVFTSVDGKKLNRGGDSAFFTATSRDPAAVFRRAYNVSWPATMLSAVIDPNDPKLSPEVSKGLADVIGELDLTDDDFKSTIEDTSVLYATPFDTTPIAYGVASTHSGDHCGGYKVLAIDAKTGERVKDVLSDGDCGF